MNGTTRPATDPATLKTYATPNRTRSHLGAASNPHAHPSSGGNTTSAGDEEAGATLKLGDFAAVDSISLSEARLISDVIFAQRRAQGKPLTDSDESRKMRGYMEDFSRFNSRATLVELEDIIKAERALSRFEGSQLVTLCPGDADEAKTLIPSLTDKIPDEDLQQLLDDINSRRRDFTD